MSKEAVIEGLNDELSQEYGAAIQYTYSASAVTGVYRPVVKSFFQEEVIDALGHACSSSGKVKSLGGVPTTKAADVPQPENVRDLLEAVLKAETETVVRYEKRKKQAEELGFTELAVQLDDMISDE